MKGHARGQQQLERAAIRGGVWAGEGSRAVERPEVDSVADQVADENAAVAPTDQRKVGLRHDHRLQGRQQRADQLEVVGRIDRVPLLDEDRQPTSSPLRESLPHLGGGPLDVELGGELGLAVE